MKINRIGFEDKFHTLFTRVHKFKLDCVDGPDMPAEERVAADPGGEELVQVAGHLLTLPVAAAHSH